MRLLLFDIDGTLLSADGAGKRALESALQEHYGIHRALAEISLAGKTDPLIIREALTRAGQTFEGVISEEFQRSYLRALDRQLNRNGSMRVLEGVIELLTALHRDSRNLLGLATGNIEGGARRKVSHARLWHFFQYGGYGSDAEDRTDVIRHAIERGRQLAGAPVNRILVIGDTPRDIFHGRQAGATTVAVASGSYDLESLRQHAPDALLPSLNSLEAFWPALDG